MLTPAAVSAVRRAVRAALRVEVGEPPQWRWAGQVPGDDFAFAAARHRVAGLLAGCPALRLPPELSGVLAEVARQDRLAAMAHVRSVADVAEALAGLDHLVFKGAALAIQTTGDLTARGAGDVDVLIDASDLEPTVERLTSGGWVVRPQHASDPRAWMWRYQRQVAHEMALDGTAGPVDVHWRLDPTHDALPDFATLWARRAVVEVGPTRVATLSAADAFAHALHHAARDDWGSLRSLVDVHRLARDETAWPERLDRLARMSLTVTEATVGLPLGVPAFRRTSAGLPRALSAQRRGVRFTRFPGDAALRYAGYCIAASHSPRDIACALAGLALPPLRVTHVSDRRALLAIGKGLLARSRPSPAWAGQR